MTTSVLVVDDDHLLRQMLSTVLSAGGVHVVGDCASGEQAIEFLTREPLPDVVLMDIQMAGMGGLMAARIIASRHPSVRVIMLTGMDDVQTITTARDTGAWGFLVKTLKPEALAAAIAAVVAGIHVRTPAIAGSQETFSARVLDEATHVSDRERAVLRGVCKGLSNLDISRRTFVSESTVKSEISALQRRLEVGNNRIRLALLAHDLGLDR